MKADNIRKVTCLSVLLLFSVFTLAYAHGTAELGEGTVRTVYVDKPKIGAKGIIVGDWHGGQVRVEVGNFPSSSTGYEVFLFAMDVPAFAGKMFVGGDPRKGVVSSPPPFGEIGALISAWKSLGDLQMDGQGNGKLEYRGGENLFDQGLNNVMVFEKVTAGPHDGPEDFSKLMIECNGPLPGTMGVRGLSIAIKVFPK